MLPGRSDDAIIDIDCDDAAAAAAAVVGATTSITTTTAIIIGTLGTWHGDAIVVVRARSA